MAVNSKNGNKDSNWQDFSDKMQRGGGGVGSVVKEKKPWGFPGSASGEEPACQRRRRKRHRFAPWVGKIPWRRARQPTPVFLPGEAHGRRSLAGYSPRGHKKADETEAT